MRGDVMVWMGRLVAGVFLLGLLALIAAVAALVQRAEGVPPLPIFGGLIAMAGLILLAGACLALISLAVSARRGLRALEAMAAGQPMQARHEAPAPVSPVPAAPVAPEATPAAAAAAPAPMQGPFRDGGLREAAMTAPPRPARPAGRVLVAER